MNKKFRVDYDKITTICKIFNIENFQINNDGTVDVLGDVDLSGQNLDKLPLKFRVVRGNFDVRKNCLTSLYKCPETITGDLFCQFNFLTSLRFGPKILCGRYFCSYNQITSLVGIPKNFLNDIICNNNALTTLHGAPNVVRNIDISFNNLNNLKFLPNVILEDLTCRGNMLNNLFDLTKVFGSIYVDEYLELQHKRSVAIIDVLAE